MTVLIKVYKSMKNILIKMLVLTMYQLMVIVRMSLMLLMISDIDLDLGSNAAEKRISERN